MTSLESGGQPLVSADAPWEQCGSPFLICGDLQLQEGLGGREPSRCSQATPPKPGAGLGPSVAGTPEKSQPSLGSELSGPILKRFCLESGVQFCRWAVYLQLGKRGRKAR